MMQGYFISTQIFADSRGFKSKSAVFTRKDAQIAPKNPCESCKSAYNILISN